MDAKLQRLLPPVLLLALGAALTIFSWRTWPDVFVDFGRELYVPWRLAAGDVLYRDVESFNGPLSPYWNALLFRVFGAGLSTLVWANLAVFALTIALIYHLIRRWAGRLAAGAACVFAMLVFGFAQYMGVANYNWVAPYSHEITHGIALSLLALLAQTRGGSGRSAAFLSGLAAGLVFLTKAEIFLALIAALGTGWLVLLRARAVHARQLFAFGIGLALPAAGACALLALALPVADAWRGTLGSWRYSFMPEVREMLFYRTGLGIDQPARRLATVGRWTLGYAALLLPVIALARWRPGRPGRRGALVAGLLCAAAAALVWFLLASDEQPELLRTRRPWLGVARPWPLLLALVVLAGARDAWRQRQDDSEGAAAALALQVFALGLLLKLGLHCRIYGYGFALAMPAACVLVAACVGRVPAWIDARGGAGAWLRAASLGALAAISAVHVVESKLVFDKKQWSIGEGSDHFRTDERGRLAKRALRDLSAVVPQDGSFLVLPEGVMLNFLTRQRSPTPFINFMPPELLFFGEDAMVAALQQSPPDAVVLVHKDTSEYGVPFFGTDYGLEIMAWVRGSYTTHSLIGYPPLRVANQYGIEILVPAE